VRCRKKKTSLVKIDDNPINRRSRGPSDDSAWRASSPMNWKKGAEPDFAGALEHGSFPDLIVTGPQPYLESESGEGPFDERENLGGRTPAVRARWKPARPANFRGHHRHPARPAVRPVWSRALARRRGLTPIERPRPGRSYLSGWRWRWLLGRLAGIAWPRVSGGVVPFHNGWRCAGGLQPDGPSVLGASSWFAAAYIDPGQGQKLGAEARRAKAMAEEMLGPPPPPTPAPGTWGKGACAKEISPPAAAWPDEAPAEGAAWRWRERARRWRASSCGGEHREPSESARGATS